MYTNVRHFVYSYIQMFGILYTVMNQFLTFCMHIFQNNGSNHGTICTARFVPLLFANDIPNKQKDTQKVKPANFQKKHKSSDIFVSIRSKARAILLKPGVKIVLKK